MNWLDIVLAIPLLWFTYKGLKNGFIIELASLASLILGIYVALYFSFYTEDYLLRNFDINDRYISILSFGITFIIVAIVVYLIGKLIHRLVNIIALGLLNRLAGGIFGFLKAALILSVLLYFLNGFDPGSNLLKPEIKERSYLYDPIQSIVPKIILRLNMEEFSLPEGDDISLPEVI